MSEEENEKGISNQSTRDYDVGYGRPPEHTRFKSGQSGNPRGRPKGTKNLKTDLSEELEEKVEIREGTRSHKVSKQRALIKSQTNKAIKGDTRAAAFLGSMMMRLLDTGEDGPEIEDDFSSDELDILEVVRERALRSAQEDESGSQQQPQEEEKAE